MSDEGRPAGAVIDDHDAAIVPEISRISDAAVAWGHDSGARVGGEGEAARMHARVRNLAHVAHQPALDRKNVGYPARIARYRLGWRPMPCRGPEDWTGEVGQAFEIGRSSRRESSGTYV